MMNEETLNTLVDEVTKTTEPSKELTRTLRMLYITQKEILTEDEAQDYIGVSPTYWKAIKRDKLIPYYLISSNKAFFRKVDIDNYLTHPERAQLSSYQIQQTHKELLLRKKVKL